jgi:hypothetical protein
MNIEGIVEELHRLVKDEGELNATGVMKASRLLALPCYEQAEHPQDLLLADLKTAIGQLPAGSLDDREGPGLMRQDAETLLIARPRDRWQIMSGSPSGTAKKWKRHFLLSRIAVELLELHRAENAAAVSHCILKLHIHVEVSHPQPDVQSRLTKFMWAVQGITSDVRTFAFISGAPNLDFADWQCESDGHIKVGRVPLQLGAPRGNHLYVVYLGATLPTDRPTNIAAVVKTTGSPGAEPWLSHTLASTIDELLLTADVPKDEAKHYKLRELESAGEMAKELWSEDHIRDSEQTMIFRPASPRAGRRYRMDWRV